MHEKFQTFAFALYARMFVASNSYAATKLLLRCSKFSRAILDHIPHLGYPPPPPPVLDGSGIGTPPLRPPPWSSRRVILFFTPRNANFAQNCKNSIRLFGVFLLWRPMVKRSKSGVFRKQSFLV